ncbi:hypothetical protein Q7689_34050, partial [Nocardiopsis tropica]|nr:hypothetical protein [Nocardiopsis tropica]
MRGTGIWRRGARAAGALGAALAVAAVLAPATAAADSREREPGGGPPLSVDGGAWPSGHVQGAALDEEKGHMYFSFTDTVVKTDLDGRVIGTVTGLTGHLGDLDFNDRDGRVYGSLEYKAAEAFYIAIFDGDRITRPGMDAEDDRVLTTVHLDEVVEDYTADMDGDGVFDGNV